MVITGPAERQQSILETFLMKTKGQRGLSVCTPTFSVGPRSWKSYDHPPPGSSPLDAQMHRNLFLAARPLADVGFGWKSGAIHWLTHLVGHLSCVKNNVFET